MHLQMHEREPIFFKVDDEQFMMRKNECLNISQ